MRGANGNMTGDLHVYLRAGTYPLAAPLTFDSRDGGSNGHYVVYEAYGTEVASISGGKRVTGWTQVTGKPYFVANISVSAGYADYFRQLYVNGVRAYRAASAWVTGSSYYNDPATSDASDGIVFATGKLKAYTNVTDLRVLHVNSFKVDEWPVVAVSSTSGGIAVELQQPSFITRVNRGYMSPADKFMIVNPKTIIFSNDFGTGKAPSNSNCVVTNYTQLSGSAVSGWPQAAQAIANAAGLESAYKPLLAKVPTTPAYDYSNK